MVEGCGFPMTERNSAWKVGNNGRDHRDKLSWGAGSPSGYEKVMSVERIYPQISREVARFLFRSCSFKPNNLR